jgi:hypothetical protein
MNDARSEAREKRSIRRSDKGVCSGARCKKYNQISAKPRAEGTNLLLFYHVRHEKTEDEPKLIFRSLCGTL